MDCWEFMKCPSETYSRCPAYPNMGRECWKTLNTLCDGGRLQMPSLAEKVAHCRGCGYFIEYASRYHPPPVPYA